MIVEIDSIELSFDHKKILYGIYLKAETGKITGLLGRNGCGKTCLIRILFGDLQPKYKNIRINKQPLKQHLFKSNLVAYLPQHGLLPKNISLKKAFRIFDASWTDFVAHFSSFAVHELSKTNQVSTGELRVIETYLILNSRKKILLLDEPFSFIAPVYIEKIKKMIVALKQEAAILITDHYYRDILDVSDELYFLKNGSSKLIQSIRELENEGYIRYSPE